MLARRVVTRSATSIRRGSQLQRRFIHPSISRLQPLPRPNTWLAKLCFQADGKPKSKSIIAWKFVGFGSEILFWLCCWIALSRVFDQITQIRDKKKPDHSSWAKMIYIRVQQTDIAYDSVNFDDPISTIPYFTKLCQPFVQYSEEELNRLFKGLMMRTKDGSTKSVEVQMQHIMRSAAEKIHGAFREYNRDSIATAELVSLVIEEAFKSLLDLMHDCDEADYHSPYWKILSG